MIASKTMATAVRIPPRLGGCEQTDSELAPCDRTCVVSLLVDLAPGGAQVDDREYQ